MLGLSATSNTPGRSRISSSLYTQWKQLNPHNHPKQDLHAQLKHVYNRKICYWEQHLVLYIIIYYCSDSDSINNSMYDNMRVCTYCYVEQHLLFDIVVSNKQPSQDQLDCDPSFLDNLCLNSDLLKNAHSPQGVLVVIVD